MNAIFALSNFLDLNRPNYYSVIYNLVHLEAFAVLGEVLPLSFALFV